MTFHLYPTPTTVTLFYARTGFCLFINDPFPLERSPMGGDCDSQFQKTVSSPFPLPSSLFHALIAKQESPPFLPLQSGPVAKTRHTYGAGTTRMPKTIFRSYYFIDWGLTLVLKSVANSV